MNKIRKGDEVLVMSGFQLASGIWLTIRLL